MMEGKYMGDAKVMKLNIGCGICPMEGYINIDKFDDYLTLAEGDHHKSFMLMNKDIRDNNWQIMHKLDLREMDGNKMEFMDGIFDEVFSNQCVGEYVTNYDEIVRVLKVGGKIKLGVWIGKVNIVLYELILRNIKITSIKGFNIGIDDNIDEDDSGTLMIEGIKVSDHKECWY